jgi:hypothetical protein
MLGHSWDRRNLLHPDDLLDGKDLNAKLFRAQRKDQVLVR